MDNLELAKETNKGKLTDKVKSVLQTTAKTIDKIATAGEIIGAAIVVISTLVINLAVFDRMAHVIGVGFGEELSSYTLAYIIFFAGAMALKKGDFVRLYFLTKRLSSKYQNILSVLSFVIGLIVLSLYMQATIGMINESLTYAAVSPTALRVPLWIPQIGIAIGLAMMLLQVIVLLFQRAYGVFRPQAEPVQVAGKD